MKMIYGEVRYAKRYKGLSPQLDKALEVLTTTDFAALEPGSYTVDDKVYYNVMEPELHDWEDTSWECHRKYIDIQYVLTEGEQIGVCPLESVKDWTEYNDEGDYAVAKDDVPCIALPMNKDSFAVLFPEDAHRPTWAVKEHKKVKKVVIKVLL